MATHIALYGFDGSSTKDGLSFADGAELEVIQKEGSGWWKGRDISSNTVGWFPASYAKEKAPQIQVPAAPPPQLPPPPQAPPPQNENPSDSQYEEIVPLNAAKIAANVPQPVYVAPPPGPPPPTKPNHAPPPPGTKPPPPAPTPAVQKPGMPPPPSPGMPPPSSPPKPMAPPPGGPPKKPAAPPPAKPNSAPPPPPPTHGKQTVTTRQSYFEEVGPAQNIPEMGGTGGGFCDNFWNDKGGRTGFDILVLKHRNGKEIFKELSEFMKARAAIEDAYGKSLTKFSKQAETFTDFGMMHDSWLKVKAELASTGESHIRLGNTLNTDFTKRIMDFKDTQKGTRKQYEATIASKRKSLVATVPNVEKLHETYSGHCIEHMKYNESAKKGQTDNQTKKDYNKILDGLDKTTKLREDAGASFKKSLEKYNTVQLEWINEMLLACQEFEDAETNRINFLKGVMRDYAVACKDTLGVAIQKSEQIISAYEKVQPAVEITTWTTGEGTGRDRPKPYPYMSPAVIEAAHLKQVEQQGKKKGSLKK